MKTYFELFRGLLALKEEALHSDITLYRDDEFLPITMSIRINTESDVLDDGHPFFVIKE